MANVTIATAANFIREQWSTFILEALHVNTVVAPLVDRKYERFARDGDTIHVPGLAEIAARTLSSMTGGITFDSATESKTDILIDKFIYAAVKIDDAVRIQSYLPEMEMYTGEIGRALGQKLDSDVFSDMDGGSNKKGTDNLDVTDDVVLDIRAALDGNKVPAEKRYMVISPDTHVAFFKIEKYVNQLYAASIGNIDASKGFGFVGHIYEADVYMSNNLPSGSSGKVNFYFQQEGEALVVQEDVEVSLRQPHDEFAEAVRARILYGVKVMRAGSIFEMLGK